jgi:hypothetical protein
MVDDRERGVVRWVRNKIAKRGKLGLDIEPAQLGSAEFELAR